MLILKDCMYWMAIREEEKCFGKKMVISLFYFIRHFSSSLIAIQYMQLFHNQHVGFRFQVSGFRCKAFHLIRWKGEKVRWKGKVKTMHLNLTIIYLNQYWLCISNVRNVQISTAASNSIQVFSQWIPKVFEAKHQCREVWSRIVM